VFPGGYVLPLLLLLSLLLRTKIEFAWALLFFSQQVASLFFHVIEHQKVARTPKTAPLGKFIRASYANFQFFKGHNGRTRDQRELWSLCGIWQCM
jgi:hypothetical protein